MQGLEGPTERRTGTGTVYCCAEACESNIDPTPAPTSPTTAPTGAPTSPTNAPTGAPTTGAPTTGTPTAAPTTAPAGRRLLHIDRRYLEDEDHLQSEAEADWLEDTTTDWLERRQGNANSSYSLTISFAVDIGVVDESYYDTASAALNSYVALSGSEGFTDKFNTTLSEQGVSWSVTGVTVTSSSLTYDEYCDAGGQGCTGCWGSCRDTWWDINKWYFIGGLGGSLLLVIVIVIVAICCCRCRRKKREKRDDGAVEGHVTVGMNPSAVIDTQPPTRHENRIRLDDDYAGADDIEFKGSSRSEKVRL